VKASPPVDDIVFQRALAVLKILRNNGHEAYLVGGCVRDILMAIKPEEYDISTSAAPNEVLKIFRKAVKVGEKFGVIRAIYKGCEFEIATFRGENGYSDGRHPDKVVYTSAREDVSRRDFTVNGMMLDPEKGEIIDYAGGLKDIKKRLIRAIGNPEERFGEDRLRILRAVRFAAKLNFKIERKTWTAIRKRAGEIASVSVERIRDEIVKMLASDYPVYGLRLLDESGLAGHIFNGETSLSLLSKDRIGMLEAFRKTGEKYKDRIIPLAIIFQGQTAGAVEKEMNRLKFPKKEIDPVVFLTANLARAVSYKDMELADKREMLGAKEPELLLEYLRIYSEVHERDGRSFRHWKGILERYGDSLIPERLMNGEDLKKMGVAPSPLMGRILRVVERAQMNEKIGTKREALKLAERLINEI